MITLYPRNQTYRLSTPIGGQFKVVSLEEVAKVAEQRQEDYAQGVELPSAPFRQTTLGVKKEDGMTLWGQKIEWHNGRKQEQWISSDLYVKARLSGTSPAEDRVDLTVLRDVRRVEPDSSLFQIPEGYTEIK